MTHYLSDLPALRRDPLALFLDKGNSTAPLVKINIGFSPVYLLNDPDLIKPLLKADESVFDKGRFIKKFEAMLGITTLTLSGDDYKRRRDVHHKYFTQGIARSFVPEICSVIRRHAAGYVRHSTFDAFEVTQPLILRVISSIIFGSGTLTPEDEKVLMEAVHGLEQDIADSFFQVLPDWPRVRARKQKKLAASRRAMTTIIEKVLAGASSLRLVHALSEIGLSAEDINNEILLLFLGGHQTTGSAAAWLLYHLSINPALCDDIAREAKDISDTAGEIDPAKLSSARLSQALVRETLRLYPSFHWFSREVKQDTEFAGSKLRKGTSIIVSNWLFHRSPRFWDKPDTFSLERSYASNAYVPFGAGPRTCLGMGLALLELQLVALEMAAAFQIGILSGTPAKPPRIGISMMPPEIILKLIPRPPSTLVDEPKDALQTGPAPLD